VGDLNSRTGCEPDFITDDTLHDSIHNAVDNVILYNKDNPEIARNSEDSEFNTSGRRLIQLCRTTNLRILNGRTVGDHVGNITFYSSIGSSVFDYAVSNLLNDMIVSFNVGDYNTHSDHAPIFVSLLLKDVKSACDCCTGIDQFTQIKNVSWKDDYKAITMYHVYSNRNSLERSLHSLIHSKESFDLCLDNFVSCVNSVFEAYCVQEKLVLKCTCSCHRSSKNKQRGPISHGSTINVKYYYAAYRGALVNREDLSSVKKRYKVCEDTLKRQYRLMEGDMLETLKRVTQDFFFY